MTENKSKFRIGIFSKSDIQPSLFHYIKETPDPSVFKDLDWNFLLHPIDTIITSWKSPRSKPSLFHYLEEEPKQPFSFKDFIKDLFTGFRNPLFIPSVFSDPESLAIERAQVRSQRWEAGVFSIVLHTALVIFMGFMAFRIAAQQEKDKDKVIDITTRPIFLPFEMEKKEIMDDQGGGGGGGRRNPIPTQTGRIPLTSRTQLIPPDPDTPQILLPAAEILAQVATVEIPMNISQDQTLPIGLWDAPPNNTKSSGPGTGGGMGTGTGTGMGPGDGAGVGPGQNYGAMGGPGGVKVPVKQGPVTASTPGVIKPVYIKNPNPPYTEEARKARTMGSVTLQAIIRKNGKVDSFQILKPLGNGLDESAIRTIQNQWLFKPATLNGEPVDMIVNFDIKFAIIN